MWKRFVVPLAGSVAALAVATGLVYALRPVAPILSLGVVYMPAVLVVAIFFGMGYAIFASIAAMLAFNFLFLPPVHTLTLADGRNWTALAVYVVTGVVASELATRARRRAAEAEQREREAALLADAAAELLHRDARSTRSARARRACSSRRRAGARAGSKRRSPRCSTSPRSASGSRTRRARRKRSDAPTRSRRRSSRRSRTTSARRSRRWPRPLDGLESGELELSTRRPRRAARDDSARARAADPPGREPARPVTPPGRRSRCRTASSGRSTSSSRSPSTRSAARRRRDAASPTIFRRRASTRCRSNAMLVNLIENALKFSPDGSPVDARRAQAGGDRGRGRGPWRRHQSGGSRRAPEAVRPRRGGRAGRGARPGDRARLRRARTAGRSTLVAADGGGTRRSPVAPRERSPPSRARP